MTVRPKETEEELLLASARPPLQGAPAAALERADGARLVREDLDWEWLVAEAERHGIVPLVHRLLGAHRAAPRAALEALRPRVQEIGRRNVVLAAELLRVLDVLDRAGIRAIPFKGPAFASSLYGDLAARSFADLDILVPAAEVRRTRAALAPHGYQPEVARSERAEDAFLRSGHEYHWCLRRSGKGILLEVHWHFVWRYFRFPLEPADLWGRLETASILGREVPQLAAEDLVPILCVQGAKDRWTKLSRLADLARLLALRGDLDWERVLRAARELHVERILHLGLLLSTEILGAPLPPAVAERVRGDRQAAAISRYVRRRLFDDEWPRSLFLRKLRRAWFHARVRERARDRAGYWLERALSPSPKDLEFVRLPGWLGWLHPLLRPVRVIARALGKRRKR